MKGLERRLNAVEDALAREGAAQRGADALGIVAEELRAIGCDAKVMGSVVVVEERPNVSPDMDARLLSIAARGPAFAAVTVVVLRDLSPEPDEQGREEFGWVVDLGTEVLLGDKAEVARGTVADLAGGSTVRALGSPTTRNTEEDA